jgi:8-oxo-dGTP pyrophosphatase MutT (NUDIX family)
MNIVKLFEKFKKMKAHELSGVALIVEGRILLVHAKKHATFNNKWSIPKGHIEGDSLDSALKELEEETGIELDDECDEKIEFSYVKGGVTKIIDVYVYLRPKSDFLKYLNGWEIKPELLDMNEIVSAKFFPLKTTARNKMDIAMVELINKLQE